jgi:hypothetical protein
VIAAPRRDAAADEERQLEHVREDLAREFTAVPPTVVDDLVREQVASFHLAPVRSFVPVLVRRGARAQLRQLV